MVVKKCERCRKDKDKCDFEPTTRPDDPCERCKNYGYTCSAKLTPREERLSRNHVADVVNARSTDATPELGPEPEVLQPQEDVQNDTLLEDTSSKEHDDEHNDESHQKKLTPLSSILAGMRSGILTVRTKQELEDLQQLTDVLYDLIDAFWDFDLYAYPLWWWYSKNLKDRVGDRSSEAKALRNFAKKIAEDVQARFDEIVYEKLLLIPSNSSRGATFDFNSAWSLLCNHRKNDSFSTAAQLLEMIYDALKHEEPTRSAFEISSYANMKKELDACFRQRIQHMNHQWTCLADVAIARRSLARKSAVIAADLCNGELFDRLCQTTILGCEPLTAAHIVWFLAIKYDNCDLLGPLLQRRIGHKLPDLKGMPRALYIAARYNSAGAAEALLKLGEAVDGAFEDGSTPLHSACKHGNLQVAKCLLRHGAKCNAGDVKGQTPLHIYAQTKFKDKGTVAVAALLIKFGADPGLKNEEGFTPLHCALQNDINIFKAIASHLAPLHRQALDVEDDKGRNVLYTAIIMGAADRVQAVLDAGSDANRRCSYSRFVPLHLAAQSGNEEIVSILLKCGADVNAKDSEGVSALHIAFQQFFLDIVRCLMASGADVHCKTDMGQNLLHAINLPLPYPSENFDTSRAIYFLHREGLDVNAQDNQGRTPMHLAGLLGRHEAMRSMTERGANPHILDRKGKTAIDYYEEKKTRERAKSSSPRLDTGLVPLQVEPFASYESIELE